MNGMRLILFACRSEEPACGTNPRAWGLTGAAPSAPVRRATDATVGRPGLPNPGGPAGQGLFGASTGPGRYYGQP